METSAKTLNPSVLDWTEYLYLLGILLLCGLIHGLYLHFYLDTIVTALHPLNDSNMYWQMGLRIFKEGWLLPNEGPYYQAPLYSYALSILHDLGYHRVLKVLLIQTGIGLVNVALTYQLARFYLPPSWARGAALLIGLCPLLLFLQTKVLATTLGIFLLLIFSNFFLLWIEQKKIVWLVVSALFLSLTVLCRPNMLFLIPVLGIVFFFPWQYHRESNQAKWTYSNSHLINGIIFFTIFLLGVAPATLRNGMVAGDWVPISANSGVTLYMGNNSQAQGALAPVEGLSNDIEKQQTDSISLASSLAGKELSPSQASNFWVQKTIRWVINNPLDFLILAAKKFLWSVYYAPPAVNYSLHFEANQIPYLQWLYPITIIIIWGGLLSIPLLLQNPKNRFLICQWVGYWLLILAYYSSDRFLATVLPFASIGSMVLVRYGYHHFAQFSIKQKFTWLVYAGITLFLVINPTLSWNRSREIGIGYYNQGLWYAQMNRHSDSYQSYMQGLRYYPTFPPLLLNLGVYHAKRGQVETAINYFESVLEIDPNNKTAQMNLQLAKKQR